jgi:hypothetical protein
MPFISCAWGDLLLNFFESRGMERGTIMKTGRTIAYIAAGIFIFFGILFVWGAFSSEGSTGWIVVGVISIAAGLGLIWFARRQELRKVTTEIVQKIDLSGDVDLESFNCRNCGAPLSDKNVEMVAGAPMVTCPNCGTSYQITEEPKW